MTDSALDIITVDEQVIAIVEQQKKEGYKLYRPSADKTLQSSRYSMMHIGDHGLTVPLNTRVFIVHDNCSSSAELLMFIPE